jgi:hypothetical protein
MDDARRLADDAGRTVRLTHISKRVLNAPPGTPGAHKHIAAAVEAAGWPPLVNLVISWRHRSALLEFETPADAVAFVAAFAPPAPHMMLDGVEAEVDLADVA